MCSSDGILNEKAARPRLPFRANRYGYTVAVFEGSEIAQAPPFIGRAETCLLKPELFVCSL